MVNVYRVLLLGVLSLGVTGSIYAAKPIDLNHQSSAVLDSLLPARHVVLDATGPRHPSESSSLIQVSQETDANNTTHIRIQQTYSGYPVWGTNAVIHVSNAGKTTLRSLSASHKPMTMNGVVYQDLAGDLANTPGYVFSSAQADKAQQQALQRYQNKAGVLGHITSEPSSLLVYVDRNNQARWVFHVRFYVKPSKGMPKRMNYLLDAVSFDTVRDRKSVV